MSSSTARTVGVVTALALCGGVCGLVAFAAPAEARTCTYTASGSAARNVGLPPSDVSKLKPYRAVLETSQGQVAFDALTSAAPCTTNSFKHLAGKRYFDGTKCHRLTTMGIFVLQCGDPTATGMGTPGYKFDDENLSGATYPAGTIAMANAGPGTNGSQFFIVYRDTQLPPAYTPFGKVTRGLDLVEKVAEAGSDNANGGGDGAPRTQVTLKSVRAVSR